jgi:predicted CoA-binding protein
MLINNRYIENHSVTPSYDQEFWKFFFNQTLKEFAETNVTGSEEYPYAKAYSVTAHLLRKRYPEINPNYTLSVLGIKKPQKTLIEIEEMLFRQS